MTGRRVRGLGYAAVGVAAFGVAVWAARRVTFGDVDPLSAGIGVVSLLVGVAALVVAVRAWRWQEVDTAAVAERLAGAVRTAEQRARGQLLGDPGRTIDVRFDFRRAPAHDAEGAARQGRLREVADYYRRLRPRRMVITGAPGAGKTVLAVELLMALLQDREPGSAVPVRLSASSWDLNADPAMQPAAATDQMERWLVTHLVEVYALPQRSAQALVDAGLVLPVVDGLDELDATDQPGYASRAAAALRVFNGYQRYRSKAELIVTCRSGHYEALTADRTWVEDAARVQIRPLDGVQAREFIAARAVDPGRWRTVLDSIQRDRRGPLAAGLDTPWRLTLAATVYEQRDPAGIFPHDPHELTSPALDTPDAVRDHLLELFIPAALRSVPESSHDPAQAHRWLAVLAGYLNDNAAGGRSLGGRSLSGTDIVLHELWPLAGFRRPRLVGLALIAAIWLVALPIMLPQVPVGFSPRQVLGASALVLPVAMLGYLSAATFWPKPQRLGLARLRTPRGRRSLAAQLANGLGGGLMFGLGGGLTAGLVPGLTAGLTAGLTFGLAGGLAGGLVFGFVRGLGHDAESETPHPRSVVRDDLASGLASGLAVGLALGLGLGLGRGLAGDLAFMLPLGLGLGLTLGFTLGIAGGPAGLRYVALLLCTRSRSGRWLPRRLGRFLDLCYRAGLIRIAGIGYQFRHRELQDYLARHPTAAG